jgi:molybdopterin-guanine dinucleotide biosynthesis protein A
MNSNRPLHGLVLAGGRSSRMGTDKAALPHPDGRPLARRTCDLLAEAGCDAVMLSLRHDQELPPGFENPDDSSEHGRDLFPKGPSGCVADETERSPSTIVSSSAGRVGNASLPKSPGHVRVIRDPEGGSEGPLAGILAAMRSAPGADWLVLACDLPRLDADTLRHLISSRLPGECFLSFRSEFDGLPEPLCAFYAAEALPILEQFQADGMRCPRKVLIRNNCRLLDPVSPRALDNANTPDDWQSALTP